MQVPIIFLANEIAIRIPEARRKFSEKKLAKKKEKATSDSSSKKKKRRRDDSDDDDEDEGDEGDNEEGSEEDDDSDGGGKVSLPTREQQLAKLRRQSRRWTANGSDDEADSRRIPGDEYERKHLAVFGQSSDQALFIRYVAFAPMDVSPWRRRKTSGLSAEFIIQWRQSERRRLLEILRQNDLANLD